MSTMSQAKYAAILWAKMNLIQGSERSSEQINSYYNYVLEKVDLGAASTLIQYTKTKIEELEGK